MTTISQMQPSPQILLAALLFLTCLAGCQRSVPGPVAGPALQGQAIDAPATPKPPKQVVAPGIQQQAPTDPAARAAMAAEAPDPVVKDGFSPVTFATLSDFVYQTDMNGRLTPESSLPEEISKLDNTAVAVSGFVMPIEFKGDKVSSMILVRNQLLCCFGEEPSLNEWMFVNIDPPVEATMDVPVTLFGTLYASPDREGDQVLSLYRMQAQAMEAIR